MQTSISYSLDRILLYLDGPTMTWRQFALSRRCRLSPMYRYVAAVSVACVVCASHLLIQQAFLPANTAPHQPSSVVVMDAVLMTTTSNHALDDTGCDVMSRKDSGHVVYCSFCLHPLSGHSKHWTRLRLCVSPSVCPLGSNWTSYGFHL